MHVGASVIRRCRFLFKREVMKETSVANVPRDDFATLLEDYMDVVQPAQGELLHGTVIDRGPTLGPSRSIPLTEAFPGATCPTLGQPPAT